MIGNASDDATAKVANAVTTALGFPLTDPRHRRVAGEFVHLAFGSANGALYGLAAHQDPRVTIDLTLLRFRDDAPSATTPGQAVYHAAL